MTLDEAIVIDGAHHKNNHAKCDHGYAHILAKWPTQLPPCLPFSTVWMPIIMSTINCSSSLSSSFASIKSCKFFHHSSIAEMYTRHIMYRAWRTWSQSPKTHKLHQFQALRGTRWHAEVKSDGNGLGWCKKLSLHDEPSQPKLLPLCNYRDECPGNGGDALTTSRLGLIKKELETRRVIKEEQSFICQELGNKSILSRKVFKA